MGNLEISAAQGAQSRPQAKRQAQKPAIQANEPILINFNSLPKSLNNEKVRKFYDKDNSGFIESKNKDGVNEYALMNDLAKSKKVDLKKYNITFDNYEPLAPFTFRVCKNAQIKGPKGTLTFSEATSKKLQLELTNKNGELLIKESEAFGVKKGKSSKVKVEFYKYKDITKGKNNIKENTQMTFKLPAGVLASNKDMCKAVSEEITDPSRIYKPKTVVTTYTLNGAKVQAKPIGKGRYEIIDKDGNVSYISHDGFKLKPEYVRNNP